MFSKMLGAIIACLLLNPVAAGDYPVRPVKLVVPAAPGGGTDILGRVLAKELGERLKQPVVVENTPGASGMIGTAAVARAAPDGHTLLFTYSAPIYYAPYLFDKVAYDVNRDLAVISQVAANYLILVVNEKVSVGNMEEFMAWARQGEGSLSYGSIGNGSAGHLASAYLNESRNLRMVHVPYQSEAPFAQDLAGGVVPWGMGTVAPMMPLIRSGKVRPIAVLADERLPALPDVPTMKEQGFAEPELDSMTWFTFSAPAGTPPPVLQLLEDHIRGIVQTPQMQATFETLGMAGIGSTAEGFRQHFAAVTPIIEALVKLSGARAE